MSHQATSWAYKQEINSCGAKFVLVALADFADEAWSCYPGQDRLAKMTGQSVSSVGRHLKWLESNGYLTRQRRATTGGHRTSDRYVLSGKETPTRQSDNKANCLQVKLQQPTGQIDPSLPVNLPEEPSVEPSVEPSAKEGRAKSARATALPDGWIPDREVIDAMKEKFPNVDMATEHEKFTDHFRSTGKPMKDWNAAWRNWIRRSTNFSRPNYQKPNNTERALNILAMGEELMREQQQPAQRELY